MGKSRFTTADVAAEVACLRNTIVGFRVSNVYDASSKVYLLKLSQSGGDGKDAQKATLVIESGLRFFKTKYTREKSDNPSNFTLKLRKHIKNKRIECIEQVGNDRIVIFTMGSGPARHYLILELYSQGNLILTDAEYKVLTLLRSHRDDANDFSIMANHAYPINHSRQRKTWTASDIKELANPENGKNWKSVLGKAIPYGSQMAEHCILISDLEPKRSVEDTLNDDEAQVLADSVNRMEEILRFSGPVPPKGFIILRDKVALEGEGTTVFEGFEPFLTKVQELKEYQVHDTFDDAVDEYYSKIESQRQSLQQIQAKNQVVGKLERIKSDQEARAQTLRNQAESTNERAQLIEYNLEKVDAAIDAVNMAVASGMDWVELEQMIKAEQQAGNPVASLVFSLQLEKNEITLLLKNTLDFSDEDDSIETHTKVPVDLTLTAHANARALYQKRKKHEKKEKKTIDACERSFKVAEKQAMSKLKHMKISHTFKVARKRFWFEKFNWFITSENYLVVSGRDAQQNEVVVKKYLRKDDIYIHADIHGAASCIIRNRLGGGAIPPISLLQAGSYCVCHSQAWNSKFTTGAWWVYSNQVSKTAPTGEYLQTGSFMIRGKKNFLQPSQLLMGFTILFKLDEISVQSHLGERAPKQRGEEDELAQDRKESIQNENQDIDSQEGQSSDNDSEEDEEDDLDVFSTPQMNKNEDALMDREKIASVDKKSSVGRRHLSAKEKRDLKKGKGGSTDEPPSRQSTHTAGQHEITSCAENSKPNANINSGLGKPKAVRGRHGKKKKMKKYADQDDEDRALAMMLLGSAGRATSSKESKEKTSALSPEGKPISNKESEKVEVAKTTTEEPVPVEKSSNNQEEVEVEKTQDEKTIEDSNEINDGDLEILDSLTALPREDDVILFCLPMCAPYSAIQNCKYKIKLTPGNLRKGKAAKASLDMLIKSNKVPQREHDLLKSIPDNELVEAVIGNCKISVPGLSKIVQNSKKSKKGQKRR